MFSQRRQHRFRIVNTNNLSYPERGTPVTITPQGDRGVEVLIGGPRDKRRLRLEGKRDRRAGGYTGTYGEPGSRFVISRGKSAEAAGRVQCKIDFPVEPESSSWEADEDGD